jgi:hypothetical protein
MLSALLFVVTFFGLAGLALWRHPICGIYLYLLVFYIHPPARYWSVLLPNVRWSMLSAMIIVLALLIHHRRLIKPPRSWASTVPGLVMMLFVLWVWVQNLWALDPEMHASASVQLFKYILAFYFIYRLADTPQKIADVLGVHVAGCLYLGWLCFAMGRTGDGRLDGVGGPGIDDANTLGMVLATGVVVAAFLALTQSGWRRIACMLAMPLILNGVILTGSRGAVLGLLAGSFVLFFLRPQQRRWMFPVFGALGLALAAMLVDDQFIDRMFTIRSAVEKSEDMDSSAESRFVMAEAQLKMFSANPLGVGHRGTATLSPFYLDERWLTRQGDDGPARSSHNTFLTALTEQGIPGFILYLWLVLWGCAVVLRLRGLQARATAPPVVSLAAACCAGLAVVLVSGAFTDYLLAEVQVWMFALLCAGLNHLRTARSLPGAAPLGASAALSR